MTFRPWVRKHPKFVYHFLPLFFTPIVVCLSVLVVVDSVWQCALNFCKEMREQSVYIRMKFKSYREELKKEYCNTGKLKARGRR